MAFVRISELRIKLQYREMWGSGYLSDLVQVVHEFIGEELHAGARGGGRGGGRRGRGARGRLGRARRLVPPQLQQGVLAEVRLARLGPDGIVQRILIVAVQVQERERVRDVGRGRSGRLDGLVLQVGDRGVLVVLGEVEHALGLGGHGGVHHGAQRARGRQARLGAALQVLADGLADADAGAAAGGGGGGRQGRGRGGRAERGLCRAGRMLWPLLVQREGLLGEAVGQRLHEVGVRRAAVRAGHGVAVVRVEVQTLLGMQ